MTPTSEPWYARPVFFVTDCERSVRFYERLGFRVAWRHEEDGAVVAAQVDRAGVELILNHNPGRAGKGRLFMSLGPGGVAEHVSRFTSAGLKVSDGTWGMPVKVVADPDGNDLLFTDDELS